MDPGAQKQEFSFAYVHAIATAAGFVVQRHHTDVDSVDVTFCAPKGSSGLRCRPRLDAQLKCTELGGNLAKDFTYPLKLKNYNDLRDRGTHTPSILLVVAVPATVASWLSERPLEMALNHCAYWVDLRGRPSPTQAKTVGVKVPIAQRFSVATLASFMAQIEQGTF